ncbi:MAG: hypothetical protein V4739_15715 [Pseudomonadota bacterium]
MTEFLLCLAVWVPLLLAVYRLIQYSDLRHTTVQASRYAAFQRIFQPDDTRLSFTAITEAVRSRFFVRPDQQPGNPRGELRSSDAARIPHPGDHEPVPLWRDLQGRPLLAHPDQVRVTFERPALPGGPGALGSVARSAWGLAEPTLQVAQVEVPVRNLLAAGGPPLHLRASTAVMGDGWNASGSAGVRDAVQGHAAVRGAYHGMALVGPVVSLAVQLLEETAPVLPCLRVESVPADRLSGAPTSPGACR